MVLPTVAHRRYGSVGFYRRERSDNQFRESKYETEIKKKRLSVHDVFIFRMVGHIGIW